MAMEETQARARAHTDNLQAMMERVSKRVHENEWVLAKDACVQVIEQAAKLLGDLGALSGRFNTVPAEPYKPAPRAWAIEKDDKLLVEFESINQEGLEDSVRTAFFDMGATLLVFIHRPTKQVWNIHSVSGFSVCLPEMIALEATHE